VGKSEQLSVVDGKIILKWVFSKWDRERGMDYAGSGWRNLAGFCEHGTEISCVIKMGGVS
jgi:hypothetical protein